MLALLPTYEPVPETTSALDRGHRVHFLRNLLAQVPKGSAEMVAAAIRTIFAQPDAVHVHHQLDVIAGMLGRQFPKLEVMPHEAATEVLAFTSFPSSHWKKIWSTNPLERLNKEIKRRTDVVGVFPNPEALLRLAGAVLVEAHDEWQVNDRRYLSEGSMALLTQAPKEVPPAQLMRHRLPNADPARWRYFHHTAGRHRPHLRQLTTSSLGTGQRWTM
jgi:putative transposase